MSEFVFECRDKHGINITPGTIVSFSATRSKGGYNGKPLDKTRYTVCGLVTDIRFNESGCYAVKVGNRLENPKKVTVVNLSADEQALVLAIKAMGGKFNYEAIKDRAKALKSVVREEVLLDLSDERPIETMGLSAILERIDGEAV